MLDTLLSGPLLLMLGAILMVLGVQHWVRSKERFAPYEKRPSLLTPAELKFFRSLREAVDGGWTICAMVRLADLIQVRPQTPKSGQWKGRILAKHVDFVLCDKLTMEARLAIELDDATHQQPERQQRDQFVDDAFAAAGLPLMRVLVADSYDTEQLRQSISGRLKQ